MFHVLPCSLFYAPFPAFTSHFPCYEKRRVGRSGGRGEDGKYGTQPCEEDGKCGSQPCEEDGKCDTQPCEEHLILGYYFYCICNRARNSPVPLCYRVASAGESQVRNRARIIT